MTTELLWFALGVMASLVAGTGALIVFLSSKVRSQKRQINALMRYKGELGMRLSILEDMVQEKKERGKL